MMKALIKDQRVRIDNHRKGAGGIDYYDDPANDIHLDKTVYDGRKEKDIYQIRVPLNSERPVTINRDEDLRMPNRIMQEIQKAFQDADTRQHFIDEVWDVLKNYPLKNKEKAVAKDEEIEGRVYEAMRRIALCFGLEWKDEQLKKNIRETQSYGTRYIGLLTEKDETYYLAFENKRIIVADYDKIGHRYIKEWMPL